MHNIDSGALLIDNKYTGRYVRWDPAGRDQMQKQLTDIDCVYAMSYYMYDRVIRTSQLN